MTDKEYLEWLEGEVINSSGVLGHYKYRNARALEIIARCMVKSNEMAREALDKSNKLFEANMAMMKEGQTKGKPVGVK